MTRPLFIGNGSMLVGLDKYAMVHDFYYPYVGLENHCNARSMHHRIGVYVDGQMSWLDDNTWDIKIDYELDAMVGATTAVNQRLQVALEFHDFVDHEINTFGRNIHIVNNASTNRDIKLFMHQVFKISESNRGDTAMFVPDGNYILDYKGNRCFIIYGEDQNNMPFDQYSIGVHGIEGKAGTYADAEDGELSNHPVEHGRVDSTIRFNNSLAPHSSCRVQYWITAAASHNDALRIHEKFKGEGFMKRYLATQQRWQNWLNIAEPTFTKLDYGNQVIFKKALFIMKSHIDKRGGILASGDSEMLNYARDNYSYCWPRDAAFVLWPMIRLGYKEEAKSFFEFARDVLTEDGSLMHKFQPDRAVGSSWHPLVHKGRPELAIQEDETAIVVFMMHQYLQYTDDTDFVRRFYKTLIQPAANFMETYIDEATRLPHASYDLWEEKFLTSTYTTAITYASLKAAAKLAERFEFPDDAIRWQTVADEIRIAAKDAFYSDEKHAFTKGFLLEEDGSRTVDDIIDISSLYGAVMFDLFDIDSYQVASTIKTVEERLLNKSPSGGVPRYEYDSYCRSPEPYLGNPWFVTTLWLGQIYNELGDNEKIVPLIEWTKQNMLKSGVLSEQIDPKTSEPVSVSPLIWSHAELVNTLIDMAT